MSILIFWELPNEAKNLSNILMFFFFRGRAEVYPEWNEVQPALCLPLRNSRVYQVAQSLTQIFHN